MIRTLGLMAILGATPAQAADFDTALAACKHAFKQTRYAEALSCFEEMRERAKAEKMSAALPMVQTYVARSFDQLNRIGEAIQAYERAALIDQSPKAAKKIRARVKLLEANHCGDLVVECQVGSDVMLNGVSKACPATFRTVPKGQVALTLRRNGAVITQSTATVVARTQTTAQFTAFAPKPAPDPEPTKPKLVARNSVWKSVVGYSLIGVGASLGGVGFYLRDQADEATEERSDELANPDGSAARANSLADDIQSAGDQKIAAWIAAGSLVAVGLGLVIWDAVDDDAPAATAWIGPGSAGVLVRF
ncbi:MAG: hypothetical protein ACI9U2_002052 [Bradymonadia bacterium]|jgi:hypothetical protein